MLGHVFQQCFQVLKRKPFRLLGLSLSSGLLILLTKSFFSLLPIIWMPISFVVTSGMALVYLDGYKGREINTEQLFSGFQSVRLFLHTACGMGWRALWLLLWGLVPIASICIGIYVGAASLISYAINTIRNPFNLFGSSSSYYSFHAPNYLLLFLCLGIGIAGIVVYIQMYYAYSFTPYILLRNPDISATEAIRVSAEKTKGHRGTLFLADFLVAVILFVVSIVLALLSIIPIIGAFFSTLLVILSVVCIIFLPLFQGLYRAGFYDMLNNNPSGYHRNPEPSRNIPPYPQNPSGPSYSSTPVPPQQPVFHEPPVLPKQPVQNQPPVTPSFLDDEKTQIPSASDFEQPTPQSSGFCTKCGAPLKPGQRFCTKCGNPVK